MLPEFPTLYGVAPFFVFAADGVRAILCLVTLATYNHSRY